MKRPTVTPRDVVVKKYYQRELYENELYFYQNYPEFCPELIAFNPDTMTLVIERATPILDIEDNIKYKAELWELLARLHQAGANHRDISLANVVVLRGRILLIDWENATEDIGRVSADLYGAREVGVEPQNPDVWWGGPWSNCPGRYWG